MKIVVFLTDDFFPVLYNHYERCQCNRTITNSLISDKCNITFGMTISVLYRII